MTPHSFALALAHLDAEQKHAVETIDGPVLVLAGPGTGKTHILACRVAHILQSTDVSARSILALTFTESGAAAMRQRLAELIGPTAYAVAVYTYHGFANKVINESGAEFYRHRDLLQIDDVARFKTLATILDERAESPLRPPRSPYHYISAIADAIKHLKNENVSPAALRQLTDDASDRLKSDPAARRKDGGLKATTVARLDRLARTRELADVYASYQQALASTGRYDWEDMVLFVVAKLQEKPELLADYQERYLYFLVDEYQDTNNVQNDLIRLLAAGPAPNIFAVGDNKQSIYRFQGASTANIESFLSWYPRAEVITLRRNYRSGQPILDVSHRLISLNHRLGPSGSDEPLTGPDADGTIEIVRYGSTDQELLGLAASVEADLAAGRPASEIAVIFRRNDEASAIADLFARHGIHYLLESGDDVLRDGDVGLLLAILKVADNPDDSEALFRYLHAPFGPMTTGDLIALSRSLKSGGELFDRIKSPASLGLKTDLSSLVAQIERWYRLTQQKNVGETVETLLADSGLLGWIVATPDSLTRMNRLRTFFNDVKRLAIDNPDAGLRDVFERVALRRTHRLALNASPLTESLPQAVRLMTAHKSKGLEFEKVYIVNCRDGLWSNAAANQKIVFPEGIVSHARPTEEEQIEEERRLFYVALTRAKKSVVLSYAELDGESKARLASQFIAELKVPATAVVSPMRSPAKFFAPVGKAFQRDFDRQTLVTLVKNQAISPTELSTFLTCPAEYVYRHVYQVPGVREPNQAYGTAMHRALEEWGKWQKAGEVVAAADVAAIFSTSLHEQGLRPSEISRYERLGQKIVLAYVARSSAPAPLAVEYNFSSHAVLLDGRVPITGRLDRIEPMAGTDLVRVVDFKTGRQRSRNEIEGKTAGADGDYKRQLVFYALLAQADPSFPFTIGQTAIQFVDDAGRFGIEVYIISSDEIADLKKLLHAVYTEILALNFAHTSHKKRWRAGESLCDRLGGRN